MKDFIFLGEEEFDLNELVFSDPTTDHIETMSVDNEIFDSEVFQILEMPPPKNDSQESLAELRISQDRALNRTIRQDALFEKYDLKFTDDLIELCRTLEIDIDESQIYYYKKQASSLILQAKYKYNRPRPKQLGAMRGVAIESRHSTSADTPSYPSGHTTQAYFLTGVISKQYPEVKEKMEEFAKAVSDSRLHAGLHFESDANAGMKMAQIMLENMIEDAVVSGDLHEAEYQGRKVTLNKPFRTPGKNKKFAVYTKNESGTVVIVRFGDPNMEIRRDDPKRRANFRSRHNCDNPGPKWKARYWSCYQWRAGAKVDD